MSRVTVLVFAFGAIVTGSLAGGVKSPAEANTPIRQHEKSKAKGFDTCEAPTVSEMRDFWSGSPYYYVGVYAGGNMRACKQANLSEDWFSRVDDIGWGFLLIHLGPQAPCTNFEHRFSSDPTTARQEGHDVAMNAINKTISYGFHVPGDVSKMGPIIYYDIEPYDENNSTCAQAVKQFVRGWTAELHEWRRLSGLYGCSCGMNWGWIWDITINGRPDDIWIAEWDDEPNVYNVNSPNDDTKWQYTRFKQYKAPMTETRNGTTLNIDKNCARGHVTGDNGLYGDNPQCY